MAQLTTAAQVLVIGGVFTIAGILFSPFLCIGLPLLIVGVILVVAEGGRTTRVSMPPFPGYASPYPYPPYPAMPPAGATPLAGQSSSPPSTTTPTSACTSCGSALTPGASFCANCGAPVQR